MLSNSSNGILIFKNSYREVDQVTHLQIVLKVAKRARWVSGVQVIQILSVWLFLFLQQVLSCHLIIPGRPSWETKTCQWIIKFQRVRQRSTLLTYSAHPYGLFWDCHVKSIKKNSRTFLGGVSFINTHLKFLVGDWQQHLLPGNLLPLLHILFTLFFKVQSKPEERQMRRVPVKLLLFAFVRRWVLYFKSEHFEDMKITNMSYLF